MASRILDAIRCMGITTDALGCPLHARYTSCEKLVEGVAGEYLAHTTVHIES